MACASRWPSEDFARHAFIANLRFELRLLHHPPQQHDEMAEGRAKQERLESEVREMKLKEEDTDVDMDTVAPAESLKEDGSASPIGVSSGAATPSGIKRQSRSPNKRQQSAFDSPGVKSEQEETIGGEVTLKLEPGKPPKLARSTSHKVEKRPPPLFFDYKDKTAEARASFNTLEECTYGNKYLGTTEHALECDCTEEWGKSFSYIPVLSPFLRGIAI